MRNPLKLVTVAALTLSLFSHTFLGVGIIAALRARNPVG